MTRTLFCSAAALAACLVAAPALADDCDASRVLTQLNALPLSQVPNGARMLVPVSVNGQSKNLLLGMATGLSTLNDSTVAAMAMPVHSSDSRLLDSAGNVSKRYVKVDDLRIGAMHAKGVDLMITPDRKAGADPVNAGVFAAGLSYHYDLELDFAGRKLAYFSPDHCAGHVIHWPASIVGVVPIAIRQRQDNRMRHGNVVQDVIVPMTSDDGTGDDTSSMGGAPSSPSGGANGNVSLDPSFQYTNTGIAGSDIQIRVMLDGKSFTANIDTNLEYSTLNSESAKAVFSVTEDSAGSAPASSLTGNESSGGPAAANTETVTVYGLHTFAHTFHSLAFEGVVVNNPQFMVRPDQMGSHDPENTNITGSHVFSVDDEVVPDITIGMDVLRQLHLYFAFKERKLYLTPAGPATDAGKPAAPVL